MITKVKGRKVYVRFKDNIWAAYLAEMGSLSSKSWGVKYAWVKPLKENKAKTVLHGFIKIVNESKGKPNELWVDQGR